MNRLHLVLFILSIPILFINCQKDISLINSGTTIIDNTIKDPITATLQGNILDETGQPASGVKITVGSKTVTTNNSGYFRINDAALDKNASLVNAEKPGYFKAFRTFNATSGVNQVVIKLMKKELAGTVDPNTGGDVNLPNGSKISLPSNGIVTELNGTSYSGNVNVYASYINPKSSDINQTIPGSFMANDKNNKRVSLLSYGMMAVDIESTSGEKLQIAKDNAAKLTIPIPSSLQSSAPATISLWYIDEQTGLWKEEGTATKNGGNYEGNVAHFSYWNADFSGPGIMLTMTLKNQQGTPLVYASVSVIVNDTNGDTSGIAHGYTDSSGQLSGLVPANKNLILEIRDQCGYPVYSQNIGPFSQNTNIGDVTVSNASPSVVTIHGKLLDCNNTSVSNGYAIISYDNIIRYENTDKDGIFSITFITCAAIQPNAQIIGVDKLSQQQGQLVNVAITSSETDAGNILACGTSSLEYMNYTLDGKDYLAKDSLAAYTYPGPYPLFTTAISGNDTNSQIWFDYNNNQSGGAFPVSNLGVNNFYRIALVAPFNVTVANYPQNIGEFFEGSFSGQFRDSVNLTPLHTIDCSFRIQKRY